MSSEGATTEVEEAEQGKYSPVVYFNYFRNNPRAVVSPLLYLVAAWAYYTLSKKFLYNSLLNLTAGRIERLSDSPFILFVLSSFMGYTVSAKEISLKDNTIFGSRPLQYLAPFRSSHFLFFTYCTC